MKTVLPVLKMYRIPIAAAVALMLIELAVELAQPVIIARMIDDGIDRHDLGVVLRWGAVLLACSLIAFTSGVVNSFYSAHTSQGLGNELRDRLFRSIQSFAYADLNRFSTATLITRLTNDVTQVQNMVFMSMRIALRAPLLVIGGVTMSFVVDARLALFFLAGVPFLAVFLFVAVNRVRRWFRSVQEKLDGVNLVLEENLAGMRLIRAFLRSPHETRRFDDASGQLMERTISALRLTETILPTILLVMNAGLMAVLWFGSREINAGTASVGDVVAIVNYTTRTTGALSIISMIIMAFSRAAASARRISEIMEAKSNRPASVEFAAEQPADVKVRKEAAFQGDIVFDGVSFRYPGTAAPILQDISCHVPAKANAAILGATGSGKTTLLLLLARLYEASAGRILLDGIDLRRIDPDALRHRIGFVPQENILFTGTVRDNIAWGKEDASMEEIVEAARRAQIHDTIMGFPQQYDTMLGQRGVNLSGGQKQRLSIARALVKRPDLLLLDDCTSALDLKTEANLLRALKDLDCTTLIVTQKISTAAKADRIVLLDDGRLLACGTHEELLQTSDLYRRICASQLGEEANRHAAGPA
jgi:ABC-type multidrug transport system, ATPase and permease components